MIDSSPKLKCEILTGYMDKLFYPMKMVELWNRLPRGVVPSPTLEAGPWKDLTGQGSEQPGLISLLALL